MAIIAIVAACDPRPSSVPVNEPDDLISEEKMTEILLDIHIVEGARSGSRILGDTADARSYMLSLFQKHNVTRAQYDSSFAYYSHFPERMLPMYDVVIDSLNLRQIHITEEQLNGASEEGR